MVKTNYTFGMIKPPAVARGLTGQILAMIEKHGFEITALCKSKMPRSVAEAFYQVHAARPFYNELVDMICSGPVVVFALRKDNAVQAWRDLMGVTDPAKAAPGTIRQLFGVDIGNNAVHGSDSDENALKEFTLVFYRNGWE